MRDVEFEFVQILTTKVDLLTLPITLEEIRRSITENEQLLVAGANIRSLNFCYELDWFNKLYEQVDLVFCDGAGVQLGARILGKKIPHRFTPPDWFPDLCHMCAKNEISLFLLGTFPEVVSKVEKIYSEKFPGLQIVGTHHGYFNKEKNNNENTDVIELINQLSPDILLIGFGMPVQEKWILENKKDLNCKVFILVGAMFDFLAGETYRGPRWLTDRGFEWLTRLLTEPKRLWRRYLIGNPKFFYRIMKQRLGKI